MGIAASMTWPTFRPEYADAAVKIAQRKRPQITERGDASGRFAEGGTTGRYASPGPSCRYAFSGRDFVSDVSIAAPAQSPCGAFLYRFAVRVFGRPAMCAECTGVASGGRDELPRGRAARVGGPARSRRARVHLL